MRAPTGRVCTDVLPMAGDSGCRLGSEMMVFFHTRVRDRDPTTACGERGLNVSSDNRLPGLALVF